MKAPAWLDRSFVGKELAKGALNAVGGIAIYAFVIWLILSNLLGTARSKQMNTALEMRAPGLMLASPELGAKGSPGSF